MSDLAPTPGQVLDGLVRRFAPPWDPSKPFHDPQLHAKRMLTCDMLVEAFGAQHPLSKIVEAYRIFHGRLNPNEVFRENITTQLKGPMDQIIQEVRQGLD